MSDEDDYVMVNIFDHGGHMTEGEMSFYGPLKRDAETREQILKHVIKPGDVVLEDVLAVGLNIKYGCSSFVGRELEEKMLKNVFPDYHRRTILK